MKKWLRLVFLLLISGNVVAQNDYPKLDAPPKEIVIDLRVEEGSYVIVYLKRYWVPVPMHPAAPSDTSGIEPIMFLNRIFEGVAHYTAFGNYNSTEFIYLDESKMIKSDTGWVYQDSIRFRCIVFPVKRPKMIKSPQLIKLNQPKDVEIDIIEEFVDETGIRLKYKDFFSIPKYEKALVADITFVPDLNYFSKVNLEVVGEKRKKRLQLTYGRAYYGK